MRTMDDPHIAPKVLGPHFVVQAGGDRSTADEGGEPGERGEGKKIDASVLLDRDI